MPTEISSNEITKSRQNPKYCYLLWRYIHHLNIYIFFHVHQCAVGFMLKAYNPFNAPVNTSRRTTKNIPGHQEDYLA